MALLAFDTLGCARRLQQAGFTAEQAEAQVEIMAEAEGLEAHKRAVSLRLEKLRD